MNTTTLDFPTIEAPPAPTPPAAVAVIPPPMLPEVPSIKGTVLAQFAEAETTVLALVEKYRDVAYDVSTTKGMNEAKAARLELREKGRFAVQRAEKAVKADVNDLKRVMSDEVERIVAIVQPVEDAIDAQIKAREKQLADEKAERDRIEAERIAGHQAGIAKIHAFLTRCQEPGMTAARISIGIGMLGGVTFGPEWEEFAVPALAAQVETLKALHALHDRAVEREAEAARLEAQRVEQERVAAEQAEQQRNIAEQAEKLALLQRETVARQQHMLDCEARIAEIHAAATGHENASAETLAHAIVAVSALDVSEAKYRQYTALAASAKESTLAALRGLHSAAMEREQRAAEPMLQDECAGLSKALAADPLAPMLAREAAAAIVAAETPAKHVITVELDSTPAFVPEVLLEPTLTLGAINDRIAPLSITGAGLALLGFEPAGRRKSAVLFHESDWPAMRAAMVKHLSGIA